MAVGVYNLQVIVLHRKAYLVYLGVSSSLSYVTSTAGHGFTLSLFEPQV